MLYLISGASGSGKSACLPLLRERLPDIAWHDFDELGVPANANKCWRHQNTERWIQVAIENQGTGQDTAVAGGIILGEVLAAPSAPGLSGVTACLLDCHDVVRVDRLRSRGDGLATQDMLNWAAWQRMHAMDPTWRPDVITSDGWSEMVWSRWSGWERGDPRWQTHAIDTTEMTIEAVADEIQAWIEKSRRK